ncbi:unnamed protein product, partial [Sphacelaria rigidula]
RGLAIAHQRRKRRSAAKPPCPSCVANGGIPSLRDSMVMPTREQVVSVKTDTEQDSDLQTTEQLPASWLPARGQVTGRVMEQQ